MHAKYSASAAHRYLNCTASHQHNYGAPRTSSKYADEGTRVHGMAAALLTNNVDEVLEYQLNAEENDAELWDAAYKYVADIQTAAAGNTLLVEQRVHYHTFLGVDASIAFGTADAIIISEDFTTVQVHDLKYGRGKRVDVESSEQLMLYALGVLHSIGNKADLVKRVQLYIHQPRNGGTTWCEYTPQTLYAFGARARRAVQAIESGAVSYTPSEETCRWCPHKANCSALYNHVMSVAGTEFEDLGAADNLPLHKLAHIYRQTQLLSIFIKAVEQRVYDALVKDGAHIEGLKVVLGKAGMRRWAASDTAVAQTLHDLGYKSEEIYETSIISPAKTEKLLRKNIPAWQRVQELITQPSAAPVVALASDPRPAVGSADGFENLNESES